MHRLLCSRIGGYTKLQLSSCLGTEAFLFEEMITVDGKEYLVGHTPEYVKAALPKEECEKMHAASGVIYESEA